MWKFPTLVLILSASASPALPKEVTKFQQREPLIIFKSNRSVDDLAQCYSGALSASGYSQVLPFGTGKLVIGYYSILASRGRIVQTAVLEPGEQTEVTIRAKGQVLGEFKRAAREAVDLCR